VRRLREVTRRVVAASVLCNNNQYPATGAPPTRFV
jgi:hypothetical protein